MVYMKLDYKYILIYTLCCLFLFWIIIKYGSKLIKNKYCPLKLKEGLTTQEVVPYPKDATINYNDINSPLYTHTVNLPINEPLSCKNFCGPKAQCAITREQCKSDIDCYGCNPGPTPQDTCITKDVSPYDAAGKLGQNQGLQYSPLTTGYNKHNADFAQIYPGSKDAELKPRYHGLDLWTPSFNEGIKLFNKSRESADEYSEGISNAIPTASKSKMPYYEQKYPTTVSATGLFYQTTPPASNAALSS